MLRRTRGLKAALVISSLLALLVTAAPAFAATTHTVCAGGCDFTTIQGAIDDAGTLDGDTILVKNGTYDQDVAVTKSVILQSENGPSTTTIRGVAGGDSSTVHVLASGVRIDGFTITRDQTNFTDPTLNSSGVAIQGQAITGTDVRNSVFTANRTAIDINNSNGNSVHNNVIDFNRTGMVFRNQTDYTSVTENQITNNYTVGIVFIDGSSNTNNPVQTAANSTFSGNTITGNWYGGIVDRQTDTNLPAPGQSPKNFSANWFGTSTPVVTTSNTSEPGGSSPRPVAYGGTDTPPGNAPDIAGPASANFDYTPLLRSGTDTAPATPGFQGDFTQLDVHTLGNQTGPDGRITEGVNLVASGGTVHVRAGNYIEDVNANKAVTLLGAGLGSTTITGKTGGPGSGITIGASNVVVDGFTVTRQGNNTTDWNDPNLNTAGLSIQGQAISGTEVRNSRFTGNRTGIDINNSNGNSVHNNTIDNNRTGMIFRNQTDNTTVTQNFVTNNWTAGILFLDGSGGTNSPPQTAVNSDFSNNDLSGNWYGGIVDRQSGGSLPAPGTNAKNFSANWFGTQTPVVTTNNTTEPGYAAQIPVAFGGTATPPGGQPDIAGPASANFDYTPLLRSGTDTAAGTLGFQGDFSDLTVTAAGAQTGSTGRIEEGVTRGTTAGTVRVLAGTFAETDTISKHTHVIGAGNSTVVDPPANGPGILIAASGTQADPLLLSSLRVRDAGGAGNTGTGISIPVSVSDVTVSHVRSVDNTGHGMAINVGSGGTITRLRLDTVDFSSNGGDGLRFPTSMGTLDGLTVTDSHFDVNGFAGMEILGPPATTPATNVTITDSSFDRNANKGIYAERLSDALLDGISVDESGTSGGFAAGIDLNLKKQAFTNITISDSQITRSGTGDPTNGVGLTIKSRDDGANGPTTLSNVNVTGNTITGNQLGIRVGEPGKNNLGPTAVHINRNNISGNVGGNGVTNVTDASVANVDATCNWWGAASGPGGSGPGTGNTVGTRITFAPFLLNSDLTTTCRPPVAVADTGITAEDTALNGASVLGNDSDPEGHSLTAVKVTNPSHGTVNLSPNGTYTYTPVANYNGPDSFTYKANNGSFDSNTVTVALTVTAVNDAPIAEDDTGTVAEDGVLNGSSVIPNDHDTENTPLTAAKASDPSHGTVTVNANGTYVYTPAANYNGPDSFTYKANDGSADSSPGKVSITVTPVNDAPVAADDSQTVNEDGTLTGSAPGVLGNDSDVDGQPLTAIKVSDPAHGTLTLQANGSYEYSPAADYNGPDSFTYKANDGSTDSNVATVSIAVNPVAETPAAEPEDKLAPVFLSARLTNKIFRVNAKGVAETLVSAKKKKPAKKGTTFVYSLSEKARVLFTIEKRKKGKKARYSRVGRFGQDAKAGLNRKKFSGKIGTKSLKPGRYRATLKATDAAGNVSVVKRLNFKVVRR